MRLEDAPEGTLRLSRSHDQIQYYCRSEENGAYARSMVRKIQAYEDNGIFPGERLILTYETEQTILNTGKIEQLVNRYL